jgi:hypothetical protein
MPLFFLYHCFVWIVLIRLSSFCTIVLCELKNNSHKTMVKKEERRIRTIHTKQWYKKKRGMDKNNSHKTMVHCFVWIVFIRLSSFCTIVLCELFLSMPLFFLYHCFVWIVLIHASLLFVPL